MTNKEKWEKWKTEIHGTKEANTRIASAQKADLTPIHLDTEDGRACFQGGHGRYETFLDYCPCGDFHRRKLPCKHIYRLAMELGLFAGNVQTDISRVKVPKTGKGLELIPALDIIESCSEDAQKVAYTLMGYAHVGAYQMPIIKNTFVTELLDKHICFESDNNQLKNEMLDTREIVALLKEKGFNVGIRKTPPEELFQIASEHLSDYINSKYDQIAVLTIEDEFADSRTKIYEYFKRKYDPQTYYDEDLNECAIYPDDEITALLVSRGFLDLS